MEEIKAEFNQGLLITHRLHDYTVRYNEAMRIKDYESAYTELGLMYQELSPSLNNKEHDEIVVIQEYCIIPLRQMLIKMGKSKSTLKRGGGVSYQEEDKVRQSLEFYHITLKALQDKYDYGMSKKDDVRKSILN